MAQLVQAQPQFITRRALAARWCASVKTIIRRENAGKLRPRREIGGTVRYAMAEVLAIEGGAGWLTMGSHAAERG